MTIQKISAARRLGLGTLGLIMLMTGGCDTMNTARPTPTPIKSSGIKIQFFNMCSKLPESGTVPAKDAPETTPPQGQAKTVVDILKDLPEIDFTESLAKAKPSTGSLSPEEALDYLKTAKPCDPPQS